MAQKKKSKKAKSQKKAPQKKSLLKNTAQAKPAAKKKSPQAKLALKKSLQAKPVLKKKTSLKKAALKNAAKTKARGASTVRKNQPESLDAKLARLNPQLEKQIQTIRKNMEIAGNLADDLKMVGLRVLDRARSQVARLPGMSNKKSKK